MKSENSLLASKFSHIYIENAVLNHPLTKQVSDRFKDSTKVLIKHYKDVFNRPGQDFQLQKRTFKLILAGRKENFLYPGPDICQDFGNKHFFYASSLLNCLYNCDYCYLQGMYPSANIVAFVNIEDFFDAVNKELAKKPLYLTLSYDSDMLAFENIIPFTSMWIGFAAQNPDIKIEIRTKSANYAAISSQRPLDNIILAWTLSPEPVIVKYEKYAPSLSVRLEAASKAILDGWNVRLCFDPIIKIENWRAIYETFINDIFTVLPPDRIYDAGIGAFRMPAEYLKKIKKARFDSDLIFYPFECQNGIAGYRPATEKELTGHIMNLVTRYIDMKKIFL